MKQLQAPEWMLISRYPEIERRSELSQKSEAKLYDGMKHLEEVAGARKRSFAETVLN